MRRGVPALVDGRVLQAEVGRQVDHRRTARDQARGHGERRGVRHGQEHEVARVERRVVVRGEGEVGGAGEAGILRDDGRARQLVGRSRSGWRSASLISSMPAKPAAPTMPVVIAMSIPFVFRRPMRGRDAQAVASPTICAYAQK